VTVYKFAILPKYCDVCKRFFWLERYETYTRLVALDLHDITCVRCSKCMYGGKHQVLCKECVNFPADDGIAHECAYWGNLTNPCGWCNHGRRKHV